MPPGFLAATVGAADGAGSAAGGADSQQVKPPGAAAGGAGVDSGCRRSGGRLRFAATCHKSSHHTCQKEMTQAHDCCLFAFFSVFLGMNASVKDFLFLYPVTIVMGDFMLLISISSKILLDQMEDAGCTLSYPLAC